MAGLLTRAAEGGDEEANCLLASGESESWIGIDQAPAASEMRFSACAASTASLDPEALALQPEFLRDHLFYVENSRRASERCFSIVRHSFQRTLPIAEAFQAIRIRQ